MAVGSFPRHLHFDDQPQCRLLRFDGRDDVVRATDMPVIQTHSRVLAYNVTHDLDERRLARQRWTSGRKPRQARSVDPPDLAQVRAVGDRATGRIDGGVTDQQVVV
jgi:hypothetical protein